MIFRPNLLAAASAAVFSVSFAFAGSAFAQDNGAANEIEELVVTGSYIKRSGFDSASPLDVIDRDDMALQGFNNLSDVIRNMTPNAGSEFNSDAFSQNVTTGTSQVNLRNLGLNATLVLLNGRRQVLAGNAADDGSNFVDLNSLIPMIAVERIETVADGSAPLYGSDAVGGVVNFITRNRFEGLEAEFQYRNVNGGQGASFVPKEDDSGSYDFSVIGGGQFGKLHLTAAFRYLSQEELRTTARDFPFENGISLAGQPGNFAITGTANGVPIPGGVPTVIGLLPSPLNLIAGGTFLATGTAIIPDPTCGAFDGTALSPVNFLCEYNFGGFFDLIPEEERIQGYASAIHEFDNGMEAYLEGAVAINDAERQNTPSFPLVTTDVVVPAFNVGNPFGVDFAFIGRAFGGQLGNTQVDNRSDHENKTYRVVAGVRGDIDSWDSWSFDTGVTYSRTENYFAVTDVLADRFAAALVGAGGPNNNEFFNPFGSAVLGLAPNTQSVIDDIMGRLESDTTNQLITVDGVVTGDIGEISGGDVGVAVGFQYRREASELVPNAQFAAGNFLFAGGQAPYDLDRDIWALFAETRLPLLSGRSGVKLLELQGAVRYESYGSGVDSLDPKAALLWQLNDDFSARASYSTSFRAPTLLQSGGSLTRVLSVVDPLSPARAVFRNMVVSGNPDLDPEESTSYNVGITLEPAAGPLQGLSFNLDYWNLDMKDIITIENPQGIANANPLDPRVLRNPISGRISGFLLEFVNANSIDASGFDMSLGLVHDFRSAGVMNFGVKSSHIFDFDLDDPTLGKLDGAGNRNLNNFARSLPEWRVNTTFGWSIEGHSASVIARYISGYQDDDNARHIADNVTFDVQYSYEVPQLWDEYQSPTISIGAINVLDQDPPRVATDPGFDSKVHSPLGRVLYVKLKQPIY